MDMFTRGISPYRLFVVMRTVETVKIVTNFISIFLHFGIMDYLPANFEIITSSNENEHPNYM